jgi:hypothetical protein
MMGVDVQSVSKIPYGQGEKEQGVMVYLTEIWRKLWLIKIAANDRSSTSGNQEKSFESLSELCLTGSQSGAAEGNGKCIGKRWQISCSQGTRLS